MLTYRLTALALLASLPPALTEAQSAAAPSVSQIEDTRVLPENEAAPNTGLIGPDGEVDAPFPPTGGAEVAPPITTPPDQPELADLRWVARPVVVFADSENDPRFRQQMELLSLYTEDLVARDVMILVDTNPDELSPLREELRPRDFTIVLIDKDGTVVQRRPAPTTVRELTHTIDRLPSRRQETNSMRQ